MLLLISPAKKLDFEEQSPNIGQTVPALLDHAQELASIMKSRSIADLKKLMKLSDNLAQLNVERYQQWTTETTEQRAKQAILAFRGDVYAGMAATAFEQQDFDFAQQHLRILSGLYGLLRPLDMIQPHRLEMGTRLENSRGKDLYAYWKSENAPLINRAVKEAGGPIVNLASNEYFSSVESPQLESPVVTPVFKDEKSGVYKVISIYAKKARGMMCDFVIRNRLQQPQQLKAFSAAGYRFSEQDSDERQL
ncbi:MAG TPA: peroxide stress protein YaaA, partial [Gammaproteobacteria bacterium]|nr:peroxide stress protein YaaA [Gammaproteobacteria bacterium]